jgi:hypothetical protein
MNNRDEIMKKSRNENKVLLYKINKGRNCVLNKVEGTGALPQAPRFSA